MNDKLKMDTAPGSTDLVESLANIRKGLGGLRNRFFPVKTHADRVQGLAEAKVKRINNAQVVKDVTETAVQKLALPIFSTTIAVVSGAGKGLINLNKEVSTLLKEANAAAEAEVATPTGKETDQSTD